MRKQEAKSNYDKDFCLWSYTQADLLRHKKFSDIDIENIAEEIECLGRSEKNELYNSTISLLLHMLKINFTPEKKGNSNSWDSTIMVARRCIKRNLKDNPSLKNYFKDKLNDAYEDAAQQAAIESHLYRGHFPKQSPWTIEEILEEKKVKGSHFSN